MSLLHRALKKAERERQVSPLGNALVENDLPVASPSRIRLMVLVSLVFVSLLAVIYLRFWRGGRIPSHASVAGESAAMAPRAGSSMDVKLLQQEVEALWVAQKWTQARTVLEKMVVLEPRNAEFYNSLGLVFRQMGEGGKAQEQYQKALSIRPDFAEALNNLGVVALAKGEKEEAEAYFQKALEKKADYPDPHFHLALLAEGAGQGSEARRHYEQFMNLAKDLDASFVLRVQQRMGRLGAP